MKNARFILMLGLTMLIWSLDGAAQVRPQKRERPPVSDFNIHFLNLEISDYRASVPGAGARSGLWSRGDHNRIPGWKPSKEVPAEVAALLIEFWLEDGAVRLEVIAYLGKSAPHFRAPDWKKLDSLKVASRLLSVDQLTIITETEQFGIQPFSVKVSRAQPWSIGAPEIINKTPALTVTHISEERPAYTITVRNVSHKHISGISWYAMTNGQNAGGSGVNGARVIGAGRLFDIHVRFGFDEARPGDDRVEQAPKRVIVIAAILFEDGTFEGEVDQSAEMAAAIAGSRIQYLRAIQLLRGASLITGDDQPKILSKLKQDIASLGEDADQEVVKELVTRFAAASEDTRNRRIKEEVGNSLKGAKSHLLQQIEKFEYRRTQAPNDANFELWLKENIEQLERMSEAH